MRQKGERKMENKRRVSLKTLLIIAMIVVAALLFNVAFDGRFLSQSNIIVLLSHAIIPTFIAWGLCFVFACDFTDMSVGAIIVLAANMAGTFGLTKLGVFGVALGGIVCAMGLMTINFLIFAFSKIPSWIAGIGMAMIYEAIGIFYSNSRVSAGLSLVQIDGDLKILAKAPFIFIVFGIGLVLAYFIYNRTEIGLNIRAIGNGTKISEAMGINIPKTIIMVGIICGFFVGCSAFLNESYNAKVNAKSGLTSLTMIFQPMAAYMLASVLSKKINIIIGIPICALLVYTIFNVMTFCGIPSGTWQEAALGIIVIVFGIIAQRKETRVVK